MVDPLTAWSTPMLALALLAGCSAPAPARPGPQADGRILLTSGWTLDPHGEQLALPSDLPVRMCVHPAERFVAVQHAGYREHMVVVFDVASRRVAAQALLPRTWSGMCWSRDGATLYVGGGTDDVLRAFPFDAASGALGRPAVWPVGAPAVLDLPAGMCAGADGALWVCLQRRAQLVRLRDGQQELAVALPAGAFPFECALARDGATVFVSLWGQAEVWAIATATGEVLARLATGQHPSELLVHPDGARLFVSNGNENTVTALDLEGGRATETIGSALQPGAPPGSTPNALALAPGGNLLLVANADNNDCAVIDVGERGRSRCLGFVPVGQYPTSVRMLRDGTVVTANGKGSAGSHANPEGPTPWQTAPRATDYTGGMFGGSLSLFPFPAPAELAVLSARAVRCAPLQPGNAVRGLQQRPADSPIPARPGEPSPIQYVVYVIKENRTYDQVLGDLPQGNGDAGLCLFPRAVTPNHHAIAEQYALLDNFYVDAEVSADGHEWSMGAYASDFVERTWPVSYGGKRTQRTPEGATVDLGYPAEGQFAIATPKNGYLWDLAAAAGVTYRSYGEFVANGKRGTPGTARVATLQGHFCPDYRSFDLGWPDGKRLDAFARELAAFEQDDGLPRLCILRLPQDHTAGTAHGAFTPRSCVAENDLALGRLLELLSRSRFWARMAVFVVEDDAQNGPDHVDAHRSVALLAGPFVRRGAVVHTMYSTCSLLRTMELVLGLPPMSQFDAAAQPMFDCFTGSPDPRTYAALPNQVPIDERNGKAAWGGEISDALDFTREDAADDLLLDEIVWRAVRGANSRMPAPVRAAFVRVLATTASVDDDDPDNDTTPAAATHGKTPDR